MWLDCVWRAGAGFSPARRVRAAVKGCKCVHVSTRLCVYGTLMQRSTDNTHPFFTYIPSHTTTRRRESLA
jgi:hypothetical protein